MSTVKFPAIQSANQNIAASFFSFIEPTETVGQFRDQHVEQWHGRTDELLLEMGSARVPLRQDGHLADVLDWSRDVAKALAAGEGLVLGDTHWLVINAMRDYYFEFTVTPTVKLLKRSVKERPTGRQIDDAVLEQLFPGGVTQQGAKIAGVPVPERSIPATKPYELSDNSTTGKNEFEFEGKCYPVAPTGNLLDPGNWNERVAELMAARENLKLSGDHWEVIYFLRGFYFEFGIAPMVKILIKHLRDELGASKADRDYLYALFPGGPARQGSRLAGLPEPPSCID